MTTTIYKLENWALISNGRLLGDLQGHPEHSSNKPVKTTAIDELQELTITHDRKCAKLVISTKSGSWYELGEPDHAYEKIFPNAKFRLGKALLKDSSD